VGARVEVAREAARVEETAAAKVAVRAAAKVVG
jgi:hypothetical protein